MSIAKEDIEKFLNISIDGGGTYHPNKDRIAFVSDRSGVYQIYTYDMENKNINKISSGEDRSTNPIYLPDGKLLYSTDVGGNERFQIMVYDESTNKTFRLTSFLEAKHRFQFATENAVYVSANILDNQRFDVFRYNFPLEEGMLEELLLEGEPFIPVSPLMVNKDETKLIVSKTKSNLSNDLIMLDLKDKSSKLLTKCFEKHNSRFYPVEFVEEMMILIRSDHGRDFMSLAVFDFENDKLDYLEDDEWDTGKSVLNDDNEIIFSKNVGGSDKLYFGKFENNRLLNIELVKLPSDYGILSSGDFRTWNSSFDYNKDKMKIILTYSAPDKITSLYEIDLNTKQCIVLEISDNEKEFNFGTFVLNKFESFDGLEVPYFMMKPNGDGPFPTIFVIHGGPEGQSRSGFSNRLQLLYSMGYMIIIPNIRGSNGYGRKYLALDDIELRLDSIKDINELAQHVKMNNDYVDGNKLIIYGGSYGGFAVLSTMVEYPNTFQIGIDIVGISNFVTFLENTADWRRRLREVEYGFLERDREFLESISPSNKIENVKSPILIIQGDNDERVPLSESIQMYEKLKEQNIPTQLLRFEDEGHGVIKRKNVIKQYKIIFEFLKTHLKN
ncbi:S9 family peptidase [archaeon]|nr:S9 family peptidase [archaeon]NDB54291.1 S9 family peptidase [archaeon]NDB78272.1 S9 family peptidase [archaeon]NDF27902.1 S9 family peptidase [archaeon]